MTGFFGLAFLPGTATFTLVDLVNELGISVFDGERAGFTRLGWRSCSGPQTSQAAATRPTAAW